MLRSVTSEAFLKSLQTSTPFAIAAGLCAILLAFALVWLPEVQDYWVGPPLGTRHIDVGAARESPAADMLESIGSQLLGTSFDRLPGNSEDRRARLRSLADEIAMGQVTLRGETTAIGFPFKTSNLDEVPTTLMLPVAAMGTTFILHSAFRETGDRKYLRLATEDAVSFARVERFRLVPRGLLWNDHATAIRIAILARLWSDLRIDHELQDSQAREILALAERSAARLAKPSLYTYHTNHGVMQNLALLQYSLAFPTLRFADEFGQLACDRLREQMAYYIHPEGPTLEHSAGYHEFGRAFLALAIELAERRQCAVPPQWRAKLEKAELFSRMLMRPDRTLPVIGHTDAAPWPAHDSMSVADPPPAEVGLYAGSGFGVSWRGIANWNNPKGLTQVAFTWSSFPSRTHKTDDDLSLTIWGEGRGWLTNTGYWPWGARGMSDANGWRGSNAPHVDGEATPALPGRLVGVAGSGELRLFDLARPLAVGGGVRRQIVEPARGIWIVVDSTDAPEDVLVTRTWTTMPDIDLIASGPNRFTVQPRRDGGTAAQLILAGGIEGKARMARGELDPFAGWVVRDGVPRPAPSLEVHQRGGSMIATVLSLDGAVRSARLAGAGAVPTTWTVVLGYDENALEVGREGSTVTVRRGNVKIDEAIIRPVQPDPAEQREVLDAFAAASARHSKPHDLHSYRVRVTAHLGWLVLLQMMVLVGIARFARRWLVRVLLASAAGWSALGLLSYFWYLP